MSQTFRSNMEFYTLYQSQTGSGDQVVKLVRLSVCPFLRLHGIILLQKDTT